MNADDYQKQALTTEKTPMFINPAIYDGDEAMAMRVSRLLHGMMGVVTEIGEAMDVLKKHFIYSKPIDWVNVMEEAGDKSWYIGLILHAAGYNYGTALERNIAKLKKRFGEAFTKKAAVERDLEAERKALEASGVVLMALCEIPRVFLHPNVRYEFFIAPGCQACAEYAAHAAP